MTNIRVYGTLNFTPKNGEILVFGRYYGSSIIYDILFFGCDVIDCVHITQKS